MGSLSAYLNYRLKAKKLHGVHSPFVYQLSEEVLYERGAKNDKPIEALRKSLLKNKESLSITDYGAGSKRMNGSQRTISQIARTSPSKPHVAQMLQRLVTWKNYEHILELGTNLGLTTAYLGSAKSVQQLISLEGDENLAKLSVKNLQNLGIQADILKGRFEETLDLALRKMKVVDLAYLDGNHRKEPTLAYFDQILEKVSPASAIAIGDIHWSEEMESAWKAIQLRKEVTVSIDLFDLGLVFFKEDQAKEHFVLKF